MMAVDSGVSAMQRNKAAVDLGAMLKKGTLDPGYLDEGAPQVLRAMNACTVATGAHAANQRQQFARKNSLGMGGP